MEFAERRKMVDVEEKDKKREKTVLTKLKQMRAHCAQTVERVKLNMCRG